LRTEDAIKLTIAQYFTPKGNYIHEKGIVLTALQRIEDVNYLHDGIQLMVETL